MNILYIQPTYDGGCVLQAILDYNTHQVPMICKLKGDDFEIITDVIEKKEGLDFNNYPNPVSSCLYINVKNIMNINH